MDDIKLNGSHWALFERELTLKKSGQPTTFWDYGFEILQNIQDRKAIEHCDKRTVDQLTKSTVLQDPIEVEKATKTRRRSQANSLTYLKWLCLLGKTLFCYVFMVLHLVKVISFINIPMHKQGRYH
jgi:hypothetical protein